MTQRNASLERGMEAIRLLRSAPISTGELARTLGVSRDTVDRILAAVRQAGFGLTTTRRGRMALHSLP